MIPQVTKRRIGRVNLVDITGSMTSLWVGRLKNQLEQVFHTLDENPVVFNFRPLSDLDTLGLKTFFDVTLKHWSLGVLSGSHDIMDLFNRYPESKRFQILGNEQDLVRLYGSDLVEGAEGEQDNRGSYRLQTALAVRFSYTYGSDLKQCAGIISNLSTHGFYIEYIDFLSVEESLTHLSPYDIQTVDFVISLPNGKKVSGQGKVLHWQLEKDQFGIGVQIAKLDSQDEIRFSDFLKSQQKTVVYH